MFDIFTSRSDRLIIDHDRVNCAVRARDVDIDVCAACPWLREINERTAQPFVRCRPPRSPRLGPAA